MEDVKKQINKISDGYNGISDNLNTLCDTKDINEDTFLRLNQMLDFISGEQEKFNLYSNDIISYLDELRKKYIPIPEKINTFNLKN